MSARGCFLAVVFVACPAAASLAQAPRPDFPRDSVSSSRAAYIDGALGIAPVWNGLAVVRGVGASRVANLNFFWPGPISAPFAGDSARILAARATGTRRLAAVLTDAGAALLAVGAGRAMHAGRLDGVNRSLAVLGASAFVVSVPLQFRADGLLSRAVWWHNAALVR